jgi:tetratricopeptide (TPR) repeat protein
MDTAWPYAGWLSAASMTPAGHGWRVPDTLIDAREPMSEQSRDVLVYRARASAIGPARSDGLREAAVPEGSDDQSSGSSRSRIAAVGTIEELAGLLRQLRRADARRRHDTELTFRELAAKTGWSHGIIGDYFAGKVLPPTERFDALIRLLGATPVEQGALATARDRVEEQRRRVAPPSDATDPGQPTPAGRHTVPGAGSAPNPAATSAPRQLPAAVFGFTGRHKHLAELDALLDASEHAPAVPICAVSGTAGVGKTSLAVHWAHRVVDRFPDGQLYVDLRGYDPDQPLEPGAALAGFLRGLGVFGADVPADVAERAARYRTLVAGKRMLIVLDNARSAAQVRPLLPGASSCFVLVTSRDDLAALVAREGARRVDLDVLTKPEAVALLRGLVGERVDSEPAMAAALGDRCGRLPLALRVAAELAVAWHSATLADLLDDLRNEQRRLDVLDDSGDPRTAVRAVFSWSYEHLSPDAARAFRLLGLHPGIDVDLYAIAALTGSGTADARRLVRELARAHLIEQTAPDRYGMHDLLRAYGAELAGGQSDAAQAVPAARARLVEHYLSAAAAAMDVLFPAEKDRRPELSRPASPMPALADEADAQRWLDAERPNLVAVTALAARGTSPSHAALLNETLFRYLYAGAHHSDALAIYTSGLQAAREVGDRAAEAVSLRNLGGLYWQWSQFHDTLRTAEQVLELYREVGDRVAVASTLGSLGIINWRLARYPEALAYCEQALVRHREVSNLAGAAKSLDNRGVVYQRLGRFHEAFSDHSEALRYHQQTGSRTRITESMDNLGLVHQRFGRLGEAEALHRASLALRRETGDRDSEADSLHNLGLVYWRSGRQSQALDAVHQALNVRRCIGDRAGEAETLDVIGLIHAGLGEHDEALAHLVDAVSLADRVGDRYLAAHAGNGLGEARYLARCPLDSIESFAGARTIALEIGARDQLARALGGLARACHAAGLSMQAGVASCEAKAIYQELALPDDDMAGRGATPFTLTS